MDEKWFYVMGSEKVGPVDKDEIEDLFGKGKILKDTYVWTGGLENWIFLEEASEFSYLFESVAPPVLPEIPEVPQKKEMDWDNLDPEKAQFAINIGSDRGGEEKVLGLFTLIQLKSFGAEHRVNEKSLIFAQGMGAWESLGNLPIYNAVFPEEEAKPVERREGERKPITARILFHDETQVHDGICANISLGGLRIFMSDFPGKLGDIISMNIHPEDSEFSFVAKGEVVHIVEGNIGFSVKFVDLDEDAQGTIESYLNK
ncbi:MAG: hypothetical protein DRQ89_08380 [Epsilonproteobacteria bacterium]|nr:MAG: hypothetical protein DRQ89_08380 [Campylobacterota bacterium]